MIPGGGGTQRLARLVGPSVAKNLLYTGRQVAAEEALRAGLADEVVAADDVYAHAFEFAAGLAKGPSLALRAAKLAVDEGLGVPWILVWPSSERISSACSARRRGSRDRHVVLSAS